MARFLLEIGGEETPARFLKNEEKDLARLMDEALNEAALAHGEIRSWVSPRRVAVLVEDLAPMQAEREEIIMGPPARIAYDENGTPTKALTGFAKTNDTPLDHVFRHKTEKGDYMAVRRHIGGKTAAELLAEICPKVIASLSFPKSMRWGSNHITFARPLHWILALLDDEVVPFQFGHVQSSRQTHGHRVHGPGPFDVASVADYANVVENKCGVTPDAAKRAEVIVTVGNRLAKEKNGKILWKDDLLDEVVGLVEHPVPLLGEFDSAYLEVPPEVLLTSMQSHQKSFGVEGPDGKLMPYFLAVLNITPEDMGVVKRGWERVLRARLEDARFFWREDLARSFDYWLEKLDHVIFIGPLGSMGEKSRRLEALCAWLADEAELEAGDYQLAARAGRLAKADLVSAMVGEFDTLQGVMGGIYAARAGENEQVAAAIKDQYLPAGPDSPLPATLPGALLSIADKADTLAGCFGLNMIPTGAADPNGLRRAALGIIRILLDRNLDLDVRQLFARARELYGAREWKLGKEDAEAKLSEFFAGRLRNYFLNQGYSVLLVDAALAAGFARVPDLKARLDALAAFSQDANYEKHAQTLKRLENIIGRTEVDATGWNNDLLEESAEKELASALEKILPELDKCIAEGDYSDALRKLAETVKPVDNFFDKVMVNCENADLRQNRLRLLNSLRSRFNGIAEFACLQV